MLIPKNNMRPSTITTHINGKYIMFFVLFTRGMKRLIK